MRDTSINVFSDDLDDNEDQTCHLHDEDEDEDEDEDDEYILENFMKDMPSAWSFRRPTSINNLWAFWNDSVTHTPTNTTNQGITDKIRDVLKHHYNDSLKYLGCVLIQFWAPITTETGCLQLVTSDQPFGLTILNDGLLNYRKHCLEYKFNVDDHGEEEVEHLGIPGRVFRQKWPECTTDVQYYTGKEYPQLNFALTCDILSSFAFPVFHTSFQDCVGVLEFVTGPYSKTSKNNCNSFLRDALKVVNLKSFICENLSDTLAIQSLQRHPLDEINKGLKVVCTTHKLPLAQTWAPCTHSFVSRQVLHLQSSAYYVRDDDNFLEFVGFCKQNDLQKGQGVVGRAYLSRKPCFCKDITQFSLTEYPLLPGARYFGLTNCFAIYLQSTYNGKHNYILEFFLHSHIAYGKNPSTFLCSLLGTMKQHFPSFKLASGEELGKELSIEIIKNQEPTPSQWQSSRSPSGCALHDDSYILKNFLKDTPDAVSFRRERFKCHRELWAFWCEPTLSPCTYHSLMDSVTHTPTTNQEITEKIKYALVHFGGFGGFDGDVDHVLIQFWAPIRTETGCLQLVTSDQPFALTYLNEKLLKYRKHCLEYKFNVDDHGKQHLGIPGLVFQRKWYEFNSDVRYYSTKEYPQRNFALTCDISAFYAFPVFSTSFQDCVGVLEFVTNTPFGRFADICYWLLMDTLEYADLKGFCCDLFIDRALESGYRCNEIYEGLKVVCGTHKLPLAQTWAPCRCYNAPAYSDSLSVSCMGQVLHLQRSQSYVQDDNNLLAEFLELCQRNDLQKGQGAVGRAYMSHKPCFCRDITQFSITEYPLVPSARHFQLTGCFAICLQSTWTGEDFILEFFLHPENTYGEDQSSFLGLLLETMRQHFPSYKLPSGEELGKELSIEFIKPDMNQEPTSFDCQSTRSPPGPEVLHNGQETMQQHSSNQIAELDVLNKGRNVVNAGQNSISVSCSGEARMNQEPAPFQRQSMRSPPGLGVLNNGQEMMQQHSSNQQLIVDFDEINNGRNVVSVEQNSVPVSCSDESNSITYEELKKHFGKKLEDVAQIFGVSRSTLKRKCRENGIRRWPQGKRNKVSSSFSRRDPPCSNLTAEKLVATVPHMTPLVTSPSKVRTITIKATHKDDVIKFQLPLSSKMVELEEEVSKRLKLNVGSYKIKYTDDDGDRILIACDKDLQDCMSAFISLGMNTIKMFIEPIATPST